MTTTTTHTPGPWTVQGLETNRNGYDWPTFAVRSPENHCLAVVGEVDRATSEKNTANAHLIAAAPEMLALLRQHIAAHDEQARLANFDQCGCSPLCKGARALLAKIDSR